MIGEKHEWASRLRRTSKGGNGKGGNCVHSGLDECQAIAFSKVLRNIIHKELNTGPVRQLVRNGRWCVPIDERPKGWEKFGVPG